jgi:type 2 lantibiotic biosynthesis protein LanM
VGPVDSVVPEVFQSAITNPLRDAAAIDHGAPPHAVPFGELWQPIAVHAAGQVPGPVGAPWADLTADLVIRLSRVGEATLWSELNARRSPRDVVLEHLRPEGPRRTKYCALLEELRSDGLLELTTRYPVLRRQLVAILRHWRDATGELLTRVQADRALLAATFGVPETACWTGARPGLSDPHHGGRTVAALTFHDGDDEHVVIYKPKDLRVDQAFQELVTSLPTPTPSDHSLRGVGVLPRNGYGYMERVPHVPCADHEELTTFFRNAGRLTAVLYLLCATDCHHENFIARGDQLFLIDAEGLFQGTPRDRNTDRRFSTARSALYDRMGESVLRLGLLPQWYFAGEQRRPRDVSALGIAPPSEATSSDIGWLEPGTDGMIAGRVERAADLPTSSPVGIGSPNRLADFVEVFCEGFASQLRRIAAETHHWLGDHGRLAPFRTCSSRFMRRATWTYLWAIKQQSESEALRSEAAQQRVLELLSRDRLPFVARPADPRVVAAETAHLRRLDIPFFEQPIDGTELRAEGQPSITEFFESSGFDNANRKLAELDAQTIELQLTMIRGVVAAKERQAHRAGTPRGSSADVGERPLSPEQCHEHATAIGDQLVDTAMRDHTGAVEWLGIEVAEDTQRSRYGPLGLSLYAGRTGIALFLAALACQGHGRADVYERTAIGALSDLSRLCDDRATLHDGRGWWREQPLGLAGGGGVLLALVHLEALLPTLAPQIERATTFLLGGLDPDLLVSDRHHDVIFGCAGLIGPLLAIGTPPAVALAQVAGDRLVDAQDASGGWTSTNQAAPLTGFSHGASGIAAALSRLHTITGHDPYLESARAGLAWEDASFDPMSGNWADLRSDPDSTTPRFMLSWCHGAPGIGLARLCLHDTALWSREIERDLRCALRSTATTTLPEDSLCCGRSGRAAILRLAAREGHGDQWRHVAARLASQAVQGKKITGTYSVKDVPGMFQGLAGIGLTLLDEQSELMPDLLSAGLLAQASTAELPTTNAMSEL